MKISKMAEVFKYKKYEVKHIGLCIEHNQLKPVFIYTRNQLLNC